MWWSHQAQTLPRLSDVAVTWCVAPVTSVEAERAFPALGQIMDEHSQKMGEVVLDLRMSMCINGELRAAGDAPMQAALALARMTPLPPPPDVQPSA